jgi:dihydrodipicolinate synthase/N-acetylneuraminate lyase
VVLYTVPPFTAYDLPLDVIVALAEHQNIIGIKESSGNVQKVAAMVAATRHIKRSTPVTEIQQAVTERMTAAPAADANGGQIVPVGQLSGGQGTAVAEKPKIKTRSKEVGFQILVGAAHTLLDSLQVGASGGVLGFAAPAPTICFEIYAAFRDNDIDLARSKQTGLTPATKRIVSEMGIPAIKYAMDLNGYYGGLPRLPLLPLSAAEKSEIEGQMAPFHN